MNSMSTALLVSLLFCFIGIYYVKYGYNRDNLVCVGCGIFLCIIPLCLLSHLTIMIIVSLIAMVLPVVSYYFF